jgi:hypothetical protein
LVAAGRDESRDVFAASPRIACEPSTQGRAALVRSIKLTWPNGYDWDPIALHDEMKEAGELRPIGDAAELSSGND